jgi:hypothetical protein
MESVAAAYLSQYFGHAQSGEHGRRPTLAQHALERGDNSRRVQLDQQPQSRLMRLRPTAAAAADDGAAARPHDSEPSAYAPDDSQLRDDLGLLGDQSLGGTLCDARATSARPRQRASAVAPTSPHERLRWSAHEVRAVVPQAHECAGAADRGGSSCAARASSLDDDDDDATTERSHGLRRSGSDNDPESDSDSDFDPDPDSDSDSDSGSDSSSSSGGVRGERDAQPRMQSIQATHPTAGSVAIGVPQLRAGGSAHVGGRIKCPWPQGCTYSNVRAACCSARTM